MNQRIDTIRIVVVAVLTLTVCGYEPAIAAEAPAKRPNFV